VPHTPEKDSCFSPGPSHSEIAAWPSQLLTDLEADSPHNTSSLKIAFQTGLQVSSDWSGMRTPETGLEAVRTLIDPLDPLSMAVEYLYSCDNAEAPRAVCLDGRVPAEHHFMDINDRVPVHIKDRLDQFEEDLPVLCKKVGPDERATILTQRSEAYEGMARLLMRESERGFGMNAAQSAGCASQQSTGVLRMGRCLQHHYAMCSVTFDPSLISINIAGATCVGFSPYGAHGGTGHESMRPYNTWAASQRVLRPKLIVFECSHRFPKERLAWWFEDIYHICFYDHPGHILRSL